jgi:hypothetical protein
MKKQLITIAMFALAGSFCLAQQPEWLGTVIYEEPQVTTETTSSVLLNNLSFEAIKIHLSLGKIISDVNPEGDALVTLKTMEELVKTDIVEALGLSDNKQETLKQYLTQSQEYLGKGISIITFMWQELSFIKLDLNSCTVDKTNTDKLYFDSVNNYDRSSSEQALEESIKNDACASQKRIEYNAKVYLLDKMTFYQGLLQEKYDLISAKQDTLISHFDVISDNVLTELQTINDTLKRYQF